MEEAEEEKENPCDEDCYLSTHKFPIIVRVSKYYEDDRDSGCGRPCHMHINGINRFPKIDTERPKPTYVTNCEQCLKVIHERDHQLAEKDEEMLKLITDFITLPKNSDDGEKEAIKTHNFQALSDIENKLLQKEKELAKLKVSECEALCYNILREKQLELRWKDLELERQCKCPNMFFRTIEKVKKLKRFTEKNPAHCFKKLQKKERKLIKREKKVDEAFKALREKRFNEEMAYLKKELKRRKKETVKALKTIELDIKTDCSCECSKHNEMIEKELERQNKMNHNACAYFPIGGYIPYWTCDTMELLKKTAYCPQEFGR